MRAGAPVSPQAAVCSANASCQQVQVFCSQGGTLPLLSQPIPKLHSQGHCFFSTHDSPPICTWHWRVRLHLSIDPELGKQEEGPNVFLSAPMCHGSSSSICAFLSIKYTTLTKNTAQENNKKASPSPRVTVSTSRVSDYHSELFSFRQAGRATGGTPAIAGSRGVTSTVQTCVLTTLAGTAHKASSPRAFPDVPDPEHKLPLCPP